MTTPPTSNFGVTLLGLASVRGLGHVGIRALQDELGDLTQVWEVASDEILAILLAAKNKDAERIAGEIHRQCQGLIETGQEEEYRLHQRGVHLVSQAELPDKLKNIPDPPRWLFIEGNVDTIFNRPMLAVVGTRQPTPEGKDAARILVQIMGAYPVTLVSGLAQGIDAEAHQASLREGLPNVAFLGHGIDLTFPAETANLRRQIIEKSGAVASEYLPKERYQRQHFVARNRLQAALSDLVIPVQATVSGGTAHTVRFAQKYKRPLLGVEWPGANGLLAELRRDGVPIEQINTDKGRQSLDARFRALADQAKGETYAFTRVERLLSSEAKRRTYRESDVERLIEMIESLRGSVEHD